MFEKYTKAQLDAAVKEAVQEAEHKVKSECTEANKRVVDGLKADHDIAMKKKDAEHEIAIKEKEFEVRHQMDDDKKALTKQVNDLTKDLAVANETIKQLDRIVDLDADIIDIKEVVNKIIDKLPNVNVGLPVAVPGGNSGKKES